MLERRFDVAKYRRINLPLVKQWFDKRGFCKMEEGLAWLAITTGCPIIAICIFTAEVYGWTDELTASYDSKVKFYGYTEVTG